MSELQQDAQAFKESQRQYFSNERGTSEHNDAATKMDELITKCEESGSLNQFLAIVNGSNYD